MNRDPAVCSEIEELAEVDPQRASERARELVAAAPNDESAAKLLRAVVGKLAAGHVPDTPHADLANADPNIAEAARLRDRGEDEAAEVLLRKYLSVHPENPEAMRLMAEIAARCGFFDNAERIARKALGIHPNSVAIRLMLARILFYHSAGDQIEGAQKFALALVEEAIKLDSKNKAALNLKAIFLAHLREQHAAIQALEEALKVDPLNIGGWVTSGIIRRTIGPVGQAVAAFRMALAINPGISRAWWELANLKTIKLFPSDVPLIEGALESDQDLDDAQRAELHFSLFKAYDDSADVENAVRHLEAGNRLKRELHPYKADDVTAEVDRSIECFTPAFFGARRGFGLDNDELIFIVGMYRAGSTLVEQILSSHSQIEGTEELFYVLEMARDIQAAKPGLTVEDFLATASSDQIEGLAGKLLELSRKHKRTERPFFIDKNPANWRYVGILHLLLPNARIIDVRRNPLDCGFANFAQHYHTGVAFSYDQRDIARYYSDYVRQMRHFEKVLHRKYHRVIYEDLVEAPEREIRRMIEFLEVPFEDSCLRFFETDRPVYTPSAQQVRQPINRFGIDRWRKYESWLSDLKVALGATLTDWRS